MATTSTPSRMPIVAVVGRPNVGKSTLVNRIVGRRAAVVEEMPGVTRDRRQFDADWAGRDFLLVDTGGWELDPGDPIDSSIRQQAEAALGSADVVVLVVDATVPLDENDLGVVTLLRRAEVPVILAANKVDDVAHEAEAAELWSLGLGQPMAVSAFHGRGVGELLDEVVSHFPDDLPAHEDSGVPRLAIIGRPNVGKSTLLNRLAGEERVIVSERPGTTRDPVDVEVEIDGQPYVLVDTAGIRRKPQITEDADFYAVLRARDALATADVALLMIDAEEGVTRQDQRIADEVVEAGVALVVLVNKWDTVDSEDQWLIERDMAQRLGFLGWAPMLRISAKRGSRLGRLGAAIETALESRYRRVPTGVLNRLVRTWIAAHPPPVRKGRRPKIHYAVQAAVAPPTIILFVSGGDLGDDYLRFIENRIREAEDFTGTPIRVVARLRVPRDR
ncbi:MAG TPA: ribosome biogenesis GTPase Der [Acidimicrobiia bacterium]|nr:ribosome biogenesis GTPase Der [Acidimicrobiia bacterium]